MKRMVILGAGESGVGAAILAKVKGYDVFVSDMGAIKPHYAVLLDQHGISCESGKHTAELILNADEVVKSPGIPDSAPMVKALIEQGTPIISEIEFAARYTNAKMICITGSNGKTTTTSLIYDMLRRAGLDVGLAGNIGNSLALQVAQQDHAYYVIELSSFQLDNMYDFRADIAILLNITPDHLDRYNYEFQNYIDAKMRITRNQRDEDALIYWSGDPVLDREIAKLRPTATLYPFGDRPTPPIPHREGENNQPVANVAYVEKGKMVVKAFEPIELPVELLSLKGKHNQYNSMAAAITAQLLHIKNDVIRESLTQFEGVEHRLQYVATVRGVRWINDSKATNVNSCWYALEAMTTPTVLILGGKDKGNDYSEIDELVKQKCHTLVFMGLHNEKLVEHFSALGYRPAESGAECGGDKRYIDTHTLADAVQACYDAAHDGDTVLLSPCCASFDLFKSYEDRGEQFMKAVREI
ncbi:MAG: UDP-N-acetylmuramoyl-L-alanine--D-glutamate ligase [Paludibacteraceae bacterium]|nr:UDP-N-acetylmuramoyl-L-alanine--D-glutamate ligase [Paludibacteraceae bacterium]